MHVTGRSRPQLDRCLAYMAQQTILVGNNLHSLLIVSNVTHHSGPLLCGTMSAQLGKTQIQFLQLGIHTHVTCISCEWRRSPSHDYSYIMIHVFCTSQSATKDNSTVLIFMSARQQISTGNKVSNIIMLQSSGRLMADQQNTEVVLQA